MQWRRPILHPKNDQIFLSKSFPFSHQSFLVQNYLYSNSPKRKETTGENFPNFPRPKSQQPCSRSRAVPARGRVASSVVENPIVVCVRANEEGKSVRACVREFHGGEPRSQVFVQFTRLCQSMSSRDRANTSRGEFSNCFYSSANVLITVGDISITGYAESYGAVTPVEKQMPPSSSVAAIVHRM